MRAIIETGGKQFTVAPEKTIRVPSIDGEPGDRGLGNGRANRWGTDVDGFLSEQDENVLVGVMVENATAVDNIEDAMARLVELGAMRLLVLNLPDLGAIPDTLGTPEAVPATQFTLDFNAALAAMLDRFRAAYPEAAVYEFDVYAFFIALRENPAAFGFVNASDPSPNFEVPGNFDGAGYVFWDDKHPTTATHALLADQVFAELNQQLPPSEVDDTPPASDDSSCFIGAIGWRR